MFSLTCYVRTRGPVLTFSGCCFFFFTPPVAPSCRFSVFLREQGTFSFQDSNAHTGPPGSAPWATAESGSVASSASKKRNASSTRSVSFFFFPPCCGPGLSVLQPCFDPPFGPRALGINNESSFEAELLEKAPECEAWGYDFSVNSVSFRVNPPTVDPETLIRSESFTVGS